MGAYRPPGAPYGYPPPGAYYPPGMYPGAYPQYAPPPQAYRPPSAPAPAAPPGIPGKMALPPPPGGMKVYAGNVVEKKTSLYVGKIPEGLEDESVKALLDNCGSVPHDHPPLLPRPPSHSASLACAVGCIPGGVGWVGGFSLGH